MSPETLGRVCKSRRACPVSSINFFLSTQPPNLGGSPPKWRLAREFNRDFVTQCPRISIPSSAREVSAVLIPELEGAHWKEPALIQKRVGAELSRRNFQNGTRYDFSDRDLPYPLQGWIPKPSGTIATTSRSRMARLRRLGCWPLLLQARWRCCDCFRGKGPFSRPVWGERLVIGFDEDLFRLFHKRRRVYEVVFMKSRVLGRFESLGGAVSRKPEGGGTTGTL